MEYQGIISGIGNPLTRQNEISSDDIAILRNFIVGYNTLGVENNGGIIGAKSFECSIISNQAIEITSGMAFAYGYFGYSPNVEFTIYPPAVTQYYIVYAEFDKSKIPNTFEIKIKNNQSNPYIRENTLRRDVLSVIRTGVHQLPLWKITVNTKGVEKIEDLRYTKSYIDRVVYTPTSNKVAKNGKLQSGVTCYTAADGDKSKLIANTEFVQREVKKAIEE